MRTEVEPASQRSPPAELIICSAIVFTRPEHVDSLAHAIAALAEVPRVDPRGRLIVLIEAQSDADVLAAIDAIRARPDVLGVQLVYQHSEPLTAYGESS